MDLNPSIYSPLVFTANRPWEFSSTDQTHDCFELSSQLERAISAIFPTISSKTMHLSLLFGGLALGT